MENALISVRNLKMYFPVGTSFLPGRRKVLKAVDDELRPLRRRDVRLGRRVRLWQDDRRAHAGPAV